jgi:hypothetical protein
MSFEGHKIKDIQGLADAAGKILDESQANLEKVEKKVEEEVQPVDMTHIGKALSRFEEGAGIPVSDYDTGIAVDEEGKPVEVSPENGIADDAEVKDGEKEESEEPEVKKEATEKEALDPVGKEDDDIDNDGDSDETDEYLKKKRAAIGKAMKKEDFTEEEVRALCHSKDHDCATIIEHPEFGLGKPVHGSHAIPDDNGFVEWYDVEFKHGIEEKVYAKDVKVLASEDHMKEEEEDGIDGTKPIDKDVSKNVTTSKVSDKKPGGTDAKVDIGDEEDGIEGSAKPNKTVAEEYTGKDSLIEALRAKNPNKKMTLEIDVTDPAGAKSDMAKAGLKPSGGGTKSIGGASAIKATGKVKDFIKYLTSKEYGMDAEDMKDAFPELFESLDEGKMKELHGHIEDGKSVDEIIKAMKLKSTPDMKKFIKGLMK